MATLLLEKPAVETETFAAVPAPAMRDQFALERGLALMLIAVAAVYLRVRDPLYNTAYMDESVYVVYGRMFLSRHFESPLATPLQWSFGWYLWPAMAAIADRVGGLLALRELAAGMGTLTVAATYGFASRVFSKTVGVGAAAVMALLAPAVLVSRIATRDSGSICFFALGLWAFAAAWQENKKRHWIAATLCLFAAFLCKYLVAIFFPALVLLALWKGKRPLFFFVMPLCAACAAYLSRHWTDLLYLLRYGGGYNSLRADFFNVYALARWDLALVALLAVLAFAVPQWRARAALMWLGALMLMAFQWKTRADYDFWKHANYALLFLAPAAVAGLLFVVQQLFRKKYVAQMVWGAVAVVVLALGAGWLGRVQSFEQFVFWPNVNPALAYFEGRLDSQDRVLVDDTVFRYYFNPALHQTQITDPMFFHYRDSDGHELFGEQAYSAAIRERAFTYVLLDGGMGEEARRMDAAIRPLLSGYQLQMYAVDPVLDHTIEVYSLPQPASSEDHSEAANAPSIQILSPANGSAVPSANTMVEGVAAGAQAGWYVRLEVFTNRWWPQGEAVPVAADGSFRQPIYLGGIGRQACYHLVRARLIDNLGHVRGTALNQQIAREDTQGSCDLQQANASPEPASVSNPNTDESNATVSQKN